MQRGSSQPHASPPTTTPSFTGRQWLFAAALLIAVLLAYQPAWYGGIVWDDEAHVTRAELRSWDGLYRIWFEPGATQQYYPLVFSAFWVEHRLWGDATLGFHLMNMVLHWTSALLLALVLRRLAVPGAFLAAAIFALHPVYVESVAWISEQKNTLSGVFYLAAMLVYLGFDRTRKRTWYCAALGLFLLALLSKTTTVTLPAALLVIFWWQRGTLSWRRDVVPLLPFFVLAVAAGLFTRWAEYNLLGAGRDEFTLSTVERFLLAGRAIWFYLSKLFWPADLVFIYPRWHLDATVWWQYLFLPAAVLLVVGLWAVRRRWRGPLAAVLFFIGTLFPVLGLFNVFFYSFSFVSDHFQYLPSLGIIALASAGLALLLGHWGLWHRPAGYMACLALLAILGTLTWRQSRKYADMETLYQATIDRNPDCWMAHNNLSSLLLNEGRLDEALAHCQRALELQPGKAEHYNNLAAILAKAGRFDEAFAHYRKALAILPDYVDAHYNFGRALAGRGRFGEAIAEYQEAIRLQPRRAVFFYHRANAWAGAGRLDRAMADYREAVEIQPDYADAYHNLGVSLASQGQFDEAATQFQRVLEINPGAAEAHSSLGLTLANQGRSPEALLHFRKALAIQPENVQARSNLAWLLATCAKAPFRNGAEAVEQAELANRLSGGGQQDVLDTLAAAYAEAGRFPEALATAHKALELALRQNARTQVDALRARLALYGVGKPYRQPLSTPASRSPKP
jgi:tetratricopeptide (TPR) repeat protein